MCDYFIVPWRIPHSVTYIFGLVVVSFDLSIVLAEQVQSNFLRQTASETDLKVGLPSPICSQTIVV